LSTGKPDKTSADYQYYTCHSKVVQTTTVASTGATGVTGATGATSQSSGGDSNIMIIVVAASAGVLLLLSCCMVVCLVRRRRRDNLEKKNLKMDANSHSEPDAYQKDDVDDKPKFDTGSNSLAATTLPTTSFPASSAGWTESTQEYEAKPTPATSAKASPRVSPRDVLFSQVEQCLGIKEEIRVEYDAEADADKQLLDL
jgi:hypothetical protein